MEESRAQGEILMSSDLLALRERNSQSVTSRIVTGPSVTSAAKLQPVQIWFSIGALLIAFEVYFTIKWVASEHFVSIPIGPDIAPVWMQLALKTGEVVMTLGWTLSFCWFVLRPWLRERALTTDGLIMLGCTLASIWDSLSNTGQYWFTYNAYLVNRGSILSVMPTTLSPHAPGSAEAWPLFFIDMLYGNFILVAILMCAILRYVNRKRPQTGAFTLIAICFVLGAIADFVIEGMVLLPLGFWSYAGGLWSMNADKYYKFPLHEAVCAGSVFAALTCLRFFVDDKGQTICERGLDEVLASPRRRRLMRAMAVLGGTILIFIVFYHVPQGLIALHSTAWPEDVVRRSYLTDRICGPQINFACPGPTTPVARPGAPRLDFAGHLRE